MRDGELLSMKTRDPIKRIEADGYSSTSGVAIVAKFTAMVEQGADGSWSACVVGEHTVPGQGDTKEDALADLRNGITG
jgi:hypothetical protein